MSIAEELDKWAIPDVSEEEYDPRPLRPHARLLGSHPPPSLSAQLIE